MIITIDGPAGSGKSSVSKKTAKQLGFAVLDTGAMYRSVAYLIKKNNISLNHPDAKSFIDRIEIKFEKDRVIANNIDVTDDIRTSEIDLLTSQYVSVDPYVREKMCLLQRKVAENLDIVAEGRDMGSRVFPDALIKIYLDANPDIRAKRRFLQLSKNNGRNKSIEELEFEIKLRDKEDSSRLFSPLCVPEGAYVIDTGAISEQEVVQKIIEITQSKLKN